MAFYRIENELDLGMSHSGAVVIDGESTVELTDEDVEILVNLIREKHSINVRKLGINAMYPELYEKLDDAYRQLAYDTEATHWLWHGYYNGYYRYDSYDLKCYCKANCGFHFEYDESDFVDDDDIFDDELFENAEDKAFEDWLDDYVHSLSDKEARDFFYSHMNAELDLDYVDYTVEIPEEIIKMAKNVEAK